MLIYCKDERKGYELEMREWKHGEYTPDFFGDMETNVPTMYPNIDGIIICTKEDLDGIAKYWEEEARCMREGIQGDVVDYTDHPSEVYFFVEETHKCDHVRDSLGDEQPPKKAKEARER